MNDKYKKIAEAYSQGESYLSLGKKFKVAPITIQKALKESKLKVQASIQGDAVRVTGAKRDDLQAAMSLLRKDITEIPISFNNFRD